MSFDQSAARSALTSAELRTLDEQVLPTARMWLRQYPGLAKHAVQALTYWGEPLIDDRGNPYRVNE